MSAPRPFRFGVLWTSGVSSAGQWKDVVRRVETLGYDSLLVTDHLDGPDLAPVPALAVAGEVTERLTLGCHVFNNDLRHPAVLARELAALDVLSGGRLEVGMGAGWKPQDYSFRGVEPDDATTRIERLEEAVTAIKALLAGETLTRAGTYYTFRDFELSPPPLQTPRPPVMIGGGSRKILELAARQADIVGINLSLRWGSWAAALGVTTPEATARKVKWIREAANGRCPAPELSLVIYLAEVGSDAGRRAESLAARYDLTTEELLASAHALVGPPERVAEKLEALRSELGTSYICIPDRSIETFAPVVERLAGR